MLKYPKISIIIPVYNCADSLKETLLSLKNQDYQGEKEIIVVDNNSTDGSDKIAQQIPNIIVLYERNIQNAAATRNRGIIQATGDIIAFIDSDCIAEKNWISQAVQIMQKKQVDRIGGKVIMKPIYPTSSVSSLLDCLYSYCQTIVVNNHQSAMTCNFITKREVLDKIGIFDHNLFEFEDIDLGKRAAKANFSIYYGENCIVYHAPRATRQEMWLKAKRNGKGAFMLCKKNLQWSGKWGWKHPFRAIKTLITPKKLYWNHLTFDADKISWKRKTLIYLHLWMLMNLGEALGYFESWLKSFVIKPVIKQENVKNSNCCSL